MRAVILAGGAGMRLRPYTTVLPKPLVPIGERPILELIIRQLASAGFRTIDLCVGHLGELIRAYFAEGPALPAGIELRYQWEDEPLGTAGALHQVEGLDEPFLVMNGDILTTLDYGELMRIHLESDAALTVAATQKEIGLELGVIEDTEQVVTGYVEKPTLSYTVSMGIYAYRPSALEHIPAGRRFDFPDVVLALVRAGERVMTYPFSGPWFDIGTLPEYERAVAAMESYPGMFDPEV
jgi:NDP-sugar pyrophosphorylase family protein